MIKIIDNSVYLGSCSDSALIGNITVFCGEMYFEANQLLLEYRLEADELRAILNKLDELNSEQGGES